jgi:hypothetical protein
MKSSATSPDAVIVFSTRASPARRRVVLSIRRARITDMPEATLAAAAAHHSTPRLARARIRAARDGKR